MPTDTTTHPGDSAVRQRLLIAALDRFTAQGYAATSVRELVAAAGVSKPVLYYHFGNKEGLYLALLHESFAGFDGLLAEFKAAPGSAREQLLRFCAVILESAAANVAVVRLSYAIYYGPPQGAPFFDFDGFFQKMLDGIATILDAGMARGEFRRLPLHALSWLIMGVLNISLQEQIFQSTPRIDGHGLNVALNLLLDGFATGDLQP